jgi:hypothetical protein
MLQYWPWPHMLCKLAPFSMSLNINVSVLTLAAISLDRCYVIFYPLKPKLRFKHFVYIMSFIWTVSIFISGYQLFIYEIEPIDSTERNHSFRCGLKDPERFKRFLTIQTIIQFAFPLTILSFSFLAIFYRIYVQKHDGPINFYIQSRLSVTRRKVIKMILIVLFVFIISWTPLQVYHMAIIINEEIN